MTVYEVFQGALLSAPFPVTQKPVRGNEPVYLTFFEVLGQPDAYASNQPQRTRHTMQVDIYGRKPIGPELEPVLRALRAAGITVGSWGPADYEEDTRWHHLPITCYFSRRNETEE